MKYLISYVVHQKENLDNWLIIKYLNLNYNKYLKLKSFAIKIQVKMIKNFTRNK